jgi:alpha-beta hydrolase superfamily lysophospholipase
MSQLITPVRNFTALPKTLQHQIQRHIQHRIQRHWSQYWLDRKLPQLAQQTCALYFQDNGESSQERCREVLQTQLSLSPVQMQRFFQTQIGQALLAKLSQLIAWPADLQSQMALRKKLLDMLAKAERFSVLSLLYQLSQTLPIKTDQVLLTAKQVDLLLNTTDTILGQLASLSQAEAEESLATTPGMQEGGANTLICQVLSNDPRLPGALGVERTVLRMHPHLRAFLYTPMPWPSGKTPVIVISHGLAARPEDLADYAKHLVSYGYVVAIPQHPGSDAHQVRSMLAGNASEVFELEEFIERPRAISRLLDELARRNQSHYQGHLDLERVGVLGNSFGSYTALALAGATIDFEQLEAACASVLETPNMSMLVQCRALALPRAHPTLKDPRVKAILLLDPIGSQVFGPRGLAPIDCPVLIITGSDDKAAPMALEPIQLFPWLRTPERYLAVIRGKSHVHDLEKLLSALRLQLIQGSSTLSINPPIINSYLAGLSVSFFEALRTGMPSAHLSATYTRSISQPPYDLYLVNAEASAALQTPLRTLHDQLTQLQIVTMQHSEGLFNVSGGLSLYYQSWLPKEPPIGTLVVVHGLGGHSGLFGNVVQAFVPQGYGVYSFDLRGSGRSPGQRGYISRWQDFRDDLNAFVQLVKTQWPDAPCWVMGHSLGGVIALDYAMQPELAAPLAAPLAGLIVTAVPLGTGVSGARLLLGRLLSQVWPKFSLSAGLKRIPPSRDRNVVIAYAHDPLRHTQGTARLATEFLKTTHWIKTHGDRLQLPVIFLHGQADQVALLEDSRAFFESLANPHKAFRTYPGAYHELHDEINHETILADISDWIQTNHNQHAR